jgi:hypothetical protein
MKIFKKIVNSTIKPEINGKTTELVLTLGCNLLLVLLGGSLKIK